MLEIANDRKVLNTLHGKERKDFSLDKMVNR